MLELNFMIIGFSASSGRKFSIKLRLLLISLDASSRLVPYSKFMKITESPSLEVEVISLRLLTELSASSTGRVTLVSISDALAPR